MATVELTKDNFDTEVQGNNFIVIDFWAPWCGPCQNFGPVYEAASEKHEGITFAKVNTEQEQELAGHFQIRSIPTLMVMRDQIIIYSQPGALPAAQFDELLENAKKLDMDEVRKQVEEQQQEQTES